MRIAKASDEAVTFQWILSTESLPDDDIQVLIELEDGEVWTGYRDAKVWRYASGDEISVNVISWGHFPAPTHGKAGDDYLFQLPEFCWCDNCSFVATPAKGYRTDLLCPDCGEDTGGMLSHGDELPEHIYDVDPRPTIPAANNGNTKNFSPDRPELSRLEKAEMDVKRQFLSDKPIAQSEAIATHYASMAQSAFALLNLIEHRRFQPNKELDEIIEQQVSVFKREHRQKLGIELSWSNEKVGE